jgi:hypothetical protein
MAKKGMKYEATEAKNTVCGISGIIRIRRGEMAEWLKAAVC